MTSSFQKNFNKTATFSDPKPNFFDYHTSLIPYFDETASHEPLLYSRYMRLNTFNTNLKLAYFFTDYSIYTTKVPDLLDILLPSELI